MAEPDHRAGLFPALLKHWRGRRGLSQLDLALVADVSARHVSFLETGRSRPSPEMVQRLGEALGVPLRQVNAMLRAAGHEPAYPDSTSPLPEAVMQALALMKDHHEPFPLIVLDRAYRVLDLNAGAAALLAAILGHSPAAGTPEGGEEPNLARLTFDPAGARPFVVNFEEVGRDLLWRIQREVLADPGDEELRALLDDLLAMPTVEDHWRRADLTVPSDPALVLHLRRGDVDLRFVVAVTAFQAPQHVAVEQVRIETWLPYDAATASACRSIAVTPA